MLKELVKIKLQSLCKWTITFIEEENWMFTMTVFDWWVLYIISQWNCPLRKPVSSKVVWFSSYAMYLTRPALPNIFWIFTAGTNNIYQQERVMKQSSQTLFYSWFKKTRIERENDAPLWDHTVQLKLYISCQSKGLSSPSTLYIVNAEIHFCFKGICTLTSAVDSYWGMHLP